MIVVVVIVALWIVYDRLKSLSLCHTLGEGPQGVHRRRGHQDCGHDADDAPSNPDHQENPSRVLGDCHRILRQECATANSSTICSPSQRHSQLWPVCKMLLLPHVLKEKALAERQKRHETEVDSYLRAFCHAQVYILQPNGPIRRTPNI